MSQTLISVRNVSKYYKYYQKPEGFSGTIKSLLFRKQLTRKAVQNISFNIKKGEFVGLIGPNGAGKTTTLKMLSGILYPTKGQVKVAGYIPQKRENDFKLKISLVMGQKSSLHPTVPAVESFILTQKMYGVSEQEFRQRLKELTELLEVEEFIHVQSRKLSLGQRMKCELINALIYNPEILFLDEPTIGLDIVSQKKIRQSLQKFNKKHGNTIILTSHYMDDVEELCKRLIIINKGKIGYDGNLKRLIRNYSKEKIIRVQFETKIVPKDLDFNYKIIPISPYELELRVPAELTKHTIGHLITDYEIKDINIENVTLEEVIADIFSKN